MIYMLKVDILVATIVFGFGAVAIFGLFAWTAAREYAHALRAMHGIAVNPRREFVVISRTRSRNHDSRSVRSA